MALLLAAAAMFVAAAACSSGDGSALSETTPSDPAPGDTVPSDNAPGDTEQPGDSIRAVDSTTPLIAFSVPIGQGDRSVHVMSADGESLTELSGAIVLGNDSQEVSWSPDGTRIAFSTNEERSRNPRYGSDIYIMRADGSDITRLTSLPGFNKEPAWSPDGSQIAFTNRMGLDSQVAVVNSDGSGLVVLTRGSGDSHDPTWSPDGSQIAFTAKYGGDNSWLTPGWLNGVVGGALRAGPDQLPHIFVMSADGTNLRKLTSDSAKEESPAWSPDGEQIAFVSVRDDGRDPYLGGNPDIYVAPADGGMPTALTDDPAGDFTPTWSLDGSQIAFASSRDSYRPTSSVISLSKAIYVMNSTGSDQSRISEIGGQFPSFGPTAPPDAISAASLPSGEPTTLIARSFPTGAYTNSELVEAISSGDFALVPDTARSRALVFSIVQQLELECGAPNDLPMRVPLQTIVAYASTPTDIEGATVNFLNTMLDVRNLAEQGDLLSAAWSVSGVFIVGGGFDLAAQQDGIRLVDNLGCESIELEQFWRNLGFLIGSRADRTPTG